MSHWALRKNRIVYLLFCIFIIVVIIVLFFVVLLNCSYVKPLVLSSPILLPDPLEWEGIGEWLCDPSCR